MTKKKPVKKKPLEKVSTKKKKPVKKTTKKVATKATSKLRSRAKSKTVPVRDNNKAMQPAESFLADKNLVQQLVSKLSTRNPDELLLGFENIDNQQKQFLYRMVSRILISAQISRRNHSRLDSRLVVTLRLGNETFSAEIKDLGMGGMFVCSERMIPAGTELEFTIIMPVGLPVVEGVAKVVHLSNPAPKGCLPGLGLQFERLDKDTLRKYLIFLISGVACPAKDEKRRHGRIKRTLRIHIRGSGTNDSALIRDISLGGLFLLTKNPPPIGTRMEFLIVNPLTLEKLDLTGKVVRTVKFDPELPFRDHGVGVSFDIPTKELHYRLFGFLTDIITLE